MMQVVYIDTGMVELTAKSGESRVGREGEGDGG